MAKNRKTLKQKRQSDARIKSPLHSSSTPETPVNNEEILLSRYQYTFEAGIKAKPGATKTIALKPYEFLSRDLRKTALVTGAIVALEIAFYYAMNRF